MDEKLLKLIVTQAEMYDLGNIANVKHHILYDSSNGVAVDITAEVEQAPLLSKCDPYDLVKDVSLLNELLSGKTKPEKDWKEAGGIPCITGFESQELSGDEYKPVRQAMIKLKNARATLDDRVEDMRKYCLTANLVKKEVPRQRI